MDQSSSENIDTIRSILREEYANEISALTSGFFNRITSDIALGRPISIDYSEGGFDIELPSIEQIIQYATLIKISLEIGKNLKVLLKRDPKPEEIKKMLTLDSKSEKAIEKAITKLNKNAKDQ